MFTFVVLILQFLFLFAVLVAYFPACFSLAVIGLAQAAFENDYEALD